MRLMLWLLAALMVATPVLVAASSSMAEERPKTLFDLLFNRSTKDKPSRAARTTSRPSSAKRSAAPVEAAPSKVDKLENARVVLVVGDFLAGGLADGLAEAYAESPGVVVVERSSGSSGFVRDDYYDWPGQIGGFLDAEKPAVAVVMIGSNDRQALKIDGKSEAPRTETWLKEYRARALTFAKEIRSRGIPMIWVGLPSFKASSMSADMLTFNDIYKGIVDEVGGEFVDIWDGFVDENGAFTTVGPDMNGQRVQLRSSDGINLTRAGRRKVAFYTEKPLAKVLGNAVLPNVETLDALAVPDLLIDPKSNTEADRTPPVSLNDPALDGGSTLLGGPAADAQPATPAPADDEQELTNGEPASPQPGRADNFALSTATGSTATGAGPETTTAISR